MAMTITFQVNEYRSRLSESIRTEATKVFTKMKSMFGPASKNNFLQVFDDEVAAFRTATKGMAHHDLVILVKDPTK